MTRASALPLFALVISLGLCSCTAVRWHKTDGDDSALAQDLTACRKLFRDRFGGAGPLAPSDPRFGLPPSQADLRMQEAQAVGTCMRGKGYALVPVES